MAMKSIGCRDATFTGLYDWPISDAEVAIVDINVFWNVLDSILYDASGFSPLTWTIFNVAWRSLKDHDA
jgi:hypothetical protein